MLFQFYSIIGQFPSQQEGREGWQEKLSNTNMSKDLKGNTFVVKMKLLEP